MEASIVERIQNFQNIIGTDAGHRGMRSLIVQGDLYTAAKLMCRPIQNTHDDDGDEPSKRVTTATTGTATAGTLVILSGFPCCVNNTPPTETDGPPGTVAIARAGSIVGQFQRIVVVTDDCNRAVFEAALQSISSNTTCSSIELETFPAEFTSSDEERYQLLVKECALLISCERAGPAHDGSCYTMRGINMTKLGFIAPIHRLVHDCPVPFIAIGDGGNELGMGKVIDAIRSCIPNGDTIGCVIAADCLIGASVSNWGGYALAAAVALLCAQNEIITTTTNSAFVPDKEEYFITIVTKYIQQCLPTEQEEIDLLHRCVAAGCRDGVSGKMEATVDGMPLERSLQCLRDIRSAALLV